MASRIIWLTDDKKRDAQVAAEWAGKSERFTYVSPSGKPVQSQRVVKATEGRTYDALLAKHGADAEALAKALASGDPEIDLEKVGRKLDDADRIWVRHDGTVLYSARILQVTYDPSGAEKSRQDFSDVEATVKEDAALPWSGRLFPLDEVVRKFALVRKLSLRHVNGLTFDFLYELAKTLQETNKLLLLGAGAKASGPLIFNTNGAPYRGFLEGRVKDGGYRLVLHLSNLELKSVLEGASDE